MGFVGDFFDTFTGGPQRRAERQLRKISNRDIALLEKIRQVVEEAARSGTFDPDKRIQQAEAESQFSEGLARKNNAAVARTLGFSPGDSEPLLHDRALSERFKLARAQMRDQIRIQTFAQYLEALRAALSSSGGAGIAALASIMNRPTGIETFLPAFLQFQFMRQQGVGGSGGGSGGGPGGGS